jgi:broad specificity phosphatase PhoE
MIVEDHKDKNVLVVTHGVIARLINDYSKASPRIMILGQASLKTADCLHLKIQKPSRQNII